MKRRSFGGFLFVLILALAVGFFSWYSSQIKQMKAVFLYAAQSEISAETLEFLTNEISDLPQIWPISSLKADLVFAESIVEESKQLQQIKDPLNNLNKIFDQLLEINTKVRTLVARLEDKLNIVPTVLLSDDQVESINAVKQKIAIIQKKTDFLAGFETTLAKLYSEESRVIILLQNTNEPRSTGGFLGSFLQLDFFANKTFTWQFKDIYSIDRNVPLSAQQSAPEWFDGLSTKISLRDANFSPDFATSAKEIIRLMESAGEKPPKIIGAIDLHIISEILNITGPIPLEKWDLQLNKYNFDMVLQFLVEGKVLGRFNVKDPVLLFAKSLFAPETLKKISIEDLKNFDYKAFLKQKNIQFYSSNTAFQQLFDDWNVSSEIEKGYEVDNFLLFDFVSIGANKSEKFVWTKLRHDSTIHADGKVENVLTIIRNNTLQPGEIQDLLQTNQWSENIRDLLDDELLWKLGAGQNRTMIRVFVPKEAQLSFGDSPSGVVTETEDEEFKIFEVPMFVSPNERITATLKYFTTIERGSLNWRPYNLQMRGTPGRKKTTFLSTIDTKDNGIFSAETFNIGRPVDLIDQFFKAVVEF